MRILKFLPLLIIPAVAIYFTARQKSNANPVETPVILPDLINEEGFTIEDRILTPDSFMRTYAGPGSFEAYLRSLPLKPHSTVPLTYNGRPVRHRTAYEAVVDMDIGDKNLQQCADAIIRLKAEYLFNRQEYDLIHFNFTNGFRVDYSEWMKGKRIVVKGNASYWAQTARPSNTYENFREYLETVFMYAGTASLDKELIPVSADSIQIGDIFIQGGTPGHAMIIVDMAANPYTHQKIFLLAQSNMPAQDIQVIQNRSDRMLSPWFSLTPGSRIISGHWTFGSENLKRFSE
jgi:hypothetical protein